MSPGPDPTGLTRLLPGGESKGWTHGAHRVRSLGKALLLDFSGPSWTVQGTSFLEVW